MKTNETIKPPSWFDFILRNNEDNFSLQGNVTIFCLESLKK